MYVGPNLIVVVVAVANFQIKVALGMLCEREKAEC